MKKLVLAVLLAISLFTLTACGSGNESKLDSSDSNGGFRNELEKTASLSAVKEFHGVTIATNKAEYSANEDILLTVTNNADFYITGDTYWQLEKFDESDQKYHICKYEIEPSFRDIAEATSWKGENRYSASLSFLGKNYEAGQYRVILGAFLIRDEKDQPLTYEGLENFYLYSEITLI